MGTIIIVAILVVVAVVAARSGMKHMKGEGGCCGGGGDAVPEQHKTLKGAKIGDNCVIGTGCVVNCEIPEGSIVRQKTICISKR